MCMCLQLDVLNIHNFFTCVKNALKAKIRAETKAYKLIFFSGGGGGGRVAERAG